MHYTATNPTIAQLSINNHFSVYNVPATCFGLSKASMIWTPTENTGVTPQNKIELFMSYRYIFAKNGLIFT
jgi:hypothetical protein